MKRHRTVLMASVCAVSLVISFLATNVARGQQRAAGSPKIVGVWESKSADGVSMLLINADGSGEFNGKELRWTFSQNILSLKFQGGTTYMYEAALAANSLVVNSADLLQPIKFTRMGSVAPGPAAPPAGPASNRGGGGLGAISAGKTSASSSGPEGTWEVQKSGGTFTLALVPGGSGTFNDEPVKWKFAQGILTLQWENGDVFKYNATLTANSLKVSGGNLSAPIDFQRAGGGSAGGGIGAGGVGGFDDEGLEGDDEGFDDPGPVPGGFGGDSGGGIGGGARAGRGGGSGGGLTGSWQNQQGMTLQFNADGTAVLNGQRYQYTSDGSTITLSASDGQMPVPESLNGNPRTVQVQGQSVLYTRTGGAGGGGGGRAGGFGGGGGGGSNPPEMAGKWCVYSGSSTGQIISGREQCFTLHANGSYEYYGASDSTNQFGGVSSQSSDSGTWSVQGSTIVANSRSQGRVVYQLEKKNNKNNDPMLCLDGQCFVTYGQKPPWPY